MKNLVLLLSIFFLLGVGNNQLQAQKKWTYMVYLFGSDLESDGNAGTNDIMEMLAAGSTNNVNIIVTTGGANKDGWREIKRFKIENGQRVPIDFTAPNNQMASPANLTSFIDWTTSNFPAEKYVLDLWNHGADIQGYGGDENNNGAHFSIPQLKQGIQTTRFISSGKKFEILGFDACLMANLEVHTNMQSFASYIVSSEQLEPGHGWNYTPIVQAMESGRATDGAALGRVIADGFIAQARNMGTKEVTLSVVNTAKISNITTALEQMFDKVGQAGISDLQKARATSEDYASKSTGAEIENNHDVVDIGDLAKNLKRVNATYGVEADRVVNAINDATIYTVKDAAQPNSTGLTLFVPHSLLGDANALQGVISRFYDPLTFSNKVKSYIKSYATNAKQNDQTPPQGSFDSFDEGDDGGFDDGFLRRPRSFGRNNNSNISRFVVSDPSDLQDARVLLLETDVLEANEFVSLGASLPDKVTMNSNGSLVLEYKWDQQWLGIGGFPVNISDIKQTVINGNSQGGTSASNCVICATTNANSSAVSLTITVPAIINPDANDEGLDVFISYSHNASGGYDLISIVPQGEESIGDIVYGQKERVQLKPGDRVMLLYDGFNEVTDETFDVVDDDAVFTIRNGNSDLALAPISLPGGRTYKIGYELTDFSQNDALYIDPRTFSSGPSNETFEDSGIKMFPNPAVRVVNIEYPFANGQNYSITITNMMGKTVYQSTNSRRNNIIRVSNLPNGVYIVTIRDDQRLFSDKLVIKKFSSNFSAN